MLWKILTQPYLPHPNGQNIVGLRLMPETTEHSKRYTSLFLQGALQPQDLGFQALDSGEQFLMPFCFYIDLF